MAVAEAAHGASIKFVCPTCWHVFDHGGARACAGCGVVAPSSGWPTLPYKFRDRYLFVEKLGSGGQGVVFKAYDQQGDGDTWVAVKVAPPRSETSKEMFRREGRAAAMLSEHPQYFVGFRGSDFIDPAYLVLDYVPWPTLKALRAAEGNLPPLDVALLGVEILRGVRCMEMRSIVHRDLKPDNIFAHRCDDGSFEVKIADLGVWVTSGGSDESLLGQLDEIRHIFGTPPYMSPEQLRGDVLTAASDVYSVALVLWLLTTGSLPFSTRSHAGWDDRAVAERLQQCKMQPARPVTMPEELYLILITALRFNAEDRVFIDPQTLAGAEHPANASTARGMEKALRRFIDDYGERRKRMLAEKAEKIRALEALLSNGEKRIAAAQSLSAKADDLRARLGRLNGESTGFELVLDSLRVLESQIETWNVAVEAVVDARKSEIEHALNRAIVAEEREVELRRQLEIEARKAAEEREMAAAVHREEMKRLAEAERLRIAELESKIDEAEQRVQVEVNRKSRWLVGVALAVGGMCIGSAISVAYARYASAQVVAAPTASQRSEAVRAMDTASSTAVPRSAAAMAEVAPSATSPRTEPSATTATAEGEAPAASAPDRSATPSGTTAAVRAMVSSASGTGTRGSGPPKAAPAATSASAPTSRSGATSPSPRPEVKGTSKPATPRPVRKGPIGEVDL